MSNQKRLSPFGALGVALALGGSFIGFTANAQDINVVNVTVAKGDGSEPIENASVIIRDGKIAQVTTGQAVVSTGRTIDGGGMWVTPGIFMPLTDLGLWDVGAVSNSNDLRAGDSPFSASLSAATAVNYASQHIAVSRVGGVTRATVTPFPSNSIFAGQGAVIDLGADPNAVIKERAFQYVVLGEAGARIAGGSRLAAMVEFENAIKEASEYAAGTWDPGSAMLTRADAEALGPVVSGNQKLYIRVERESDIRALIKLAQQYSRLDLVLVGVSEGWLAARELAASGIPVIADPLDDLPSSFEQLAATQSNIGRMTQAGVKVAIGGMTGGIEAPRNATQYAGNLVALTKVPRATGLSWGQALATITSIPADISGYGGKYGVLKPGAAGDFVMWDGDPLEVKSAPMRVFIDGVEQPLSNHQTRLRERYRDLDESDLPKAYDH